MGCGVDQVCTLDTGCGANADCLGNQGPGTPTGWAEVIVAQTTLIKDSHVTELQTAINNERTHGTRRGAGTSTACTSNTPGSFSFTAGVATGQLVRDDHINEVGSAINGTPYNVDGNTEGPGTPISLPFVNDGELIGKTHIDDLRAAINLAQSNCICDSFCSCDVNCGCFNQLVCVCNVDIY